MRRLWFGLALLAALPVDAARSQNLLEGHEDYFEGARLEKGVVSAKTTAAFEKLNSVKRAAEIKKVMLELDQSLDSLEGPLLFKIEEGAGGTLWAMPEGGRQPFQFESWDKSKDFSLADSPAGRWFTYIGIGAVLGVPKEFQSASIGINCGFKVGTFLLKDFLDLGVNLGGGSSFGFSAYSTDMTYSYNVGVFSRVHFPILGPVRGNVGGEGSLMGSSTSSSSNVSYGSSSSRSSSSSSGTESAFLAGLSIFLPFGSIDFNGRFSTLNSYNIGLTTYFSGGAGKAVPAGKTRADQD